MVMSNKFCRAHGLIIILLFLLHALSATAAETSSGMDRIAVTVNNDAIMLSEIEARAQNLQASSKSTAEPSRQPLLRRVIEQLVDERLQLQQAMTMGLATDDPKQAIAALYDRKTQGAVKISEQEINDLIASQSDNLTKGERFNLQHILINIPNNAPIEQINNAQKRATRIHARLQSGADFTQIARNESDSYAAKSGGNLGWQNAEKLPISFNQALTLMQSGEISDIIRDPKGFHILKLLAREGGKQRAVLRDKAKTYLMERKAGEYYKAWLQKLRSQALVEYRIPLNQIVLQSK